MLVLAKRGHEFGSVTGRARRCGWFDAAALKRSIQINGVSGLCVTKLDVMDSIETIKLCTGYMLDGKEIDILPIGAENIASCEPIYEEMPGWSESTYGVKNFDELPLNAQNYLKRIAEICEAPIAIVSTGPDRDETIVLQHPYKDEYQHKMHKINQKADLLFLLDDFFIGVFVLSKTYIRCFQSATLANRGCSTPSNTTLSTNIVNGRTHKAPSPYSGRYSTIHSTVSLCITKSIT